jgi:hypothetical protein
MPASAGFRQVGSREELDPTYIVSAGNGSCRKLGRETHQGEVGLVPGDEYFAIRDFSEGART